MRLFIISVIGVCLFVGAWFVYLEIYTATAQDADAVTFQIKTDETVSQLADRLEKEGVIRNAWFFKKYLQWKNLDKKIPAGEFKVEKPITLARVVGAIGDPAISDRTITIIPGWNLRDIAEYLEKQGVGSQEDFYQLVGYPPAHIKTASTFWKDKYSQFDLLKAVDSLNNLEGYLAPETYRIYQDASLNDVVVKLLSERDQQFTVEMKNDIAKSKHGVNEIITLASIVEREANNPTDMALVADIFWRRLKENWALQSCATVNYVTGKNTPAVSAEDQQIDSLYNTYKYPGLPPGPISNPGLDAIKATVYPQANNYSYFMTGNDGKMYYAKTLEEHNANVYKYLR